MDFDLSKPQQLLKDSVRGFARRSCPLSKVRELMETETAADAALWEGIAEQGWVGLHLPEDLGGLGLGLVDLAVVSEELGRACVPGPFLATNLAATILARSGNESVREQWLPQFAEGSKIATSALLEAEPSRYLEDVTLALTSDGAGGKLTGSKHFVLDAGVADVVVCVVRKGEELCLCLVRPGETGVTIIPTPGIDATRKLCRIDFDGARVKEEDIVAVGAAAEMAVHHGMQVGAVMVCAEMVGAMQWMLETTVEYAKTRKQFDQVIGSFQAIQHKCADMLLKLESARSATYYAAWAVTEQTDDADRAVSVAKSYASDAAREVGNLAVQSLGGIGFTWEHDLQLFYKRNKLNEFLFGDPTFHRERIARAIIDAA